MWSCFLHGVKSMKNKIIIMTSFFFLLRLFILPEISFAVTVADLYPAAKVFDSVTSSLTLPAKIETVTSAIAVDSTVALTLDVVNLSLLAGIAGCAGFVYAGAAFFDYLNSTVNPNVYYDTNTGILSKHVPPVIAPCTGQLGDYYNFIGYYADSGSTWSALHSAGCDGYVNHSIDCPDGHSWPALLCQMTTTPFSYYYGITTGNPPFIVVPAQVSDVSTQLAYDLLHPGGNYNSAVAFALDAVNKTAAIYPTGAAGGSNGGAASMATAGSTLAAQIKAAYNSALTGGQTSAAAAAAASTDPATQADKVVTSTDAKTNTTAAIVAALQSQGLSATQIAAAIAAAEQAQAQGLTQAQAQAAVTAALVSQGVNALAIGAAVATAIQGTYLANPALTQAQVQTAVQAGVTTALHAEFGDNVDAPPDVVPVVPTKLSLTEIMQSFMYSINSLPMMQTLNGLHITSAGSSSLCLNLPADMGGQRCYDCGGWSGTMNMIGDAFFGLTSLMSFIYVFKG